MKIIGKSKYFLITMFMLMGSCIDQKTSKTKIKKEDILFTQVVKGFAAHLYRDYYRYSKRTRKDSKGGTVIDWPINHRVDDPHNSRKRKRMRNSR